MLAADVRDSVNKGGKSRSCSVRSVLESRCGKEQCF